ncbi:hypothetical protein ACTD5D_36390 [Nocardia takedensis]|uniref:hypothetical protein n=1 Tax=Nocardia takedensis TaxID=259390 RepID=UPI000317061A|nr:hypothetical protein [Nocardia takedensis]
MATKTRKKPFASGARRTTKNPTTGIRFTDADKVLVDKLARPGETKADVIRRALHELERREWLLAAQQDAERIDASGEDLNEEPDAW